MKEPRTSYSEPTPYCLLKRVQIQSHKEELPFKKVIFSCWAKCVLMTDEKNKIK